jgi:hypothetical protein
MNGEPSRRPWKRWAVLCGVVLSVIPLIICGDILFLLVSDARKRPATPQAASNENEMTVLVLDADSELPISGVPVRLSPQVPRSALSEVVTWFRTVERITGVDGKVTFEKLTSRTDNGFAICVEDSQAYRTASPKTDYRKPPGVSFVMWLERKHPK